MTYEDVSGGDVTPSGAEFQGPLPQADGADKEFPMVGMRRINEVEPLLPPGFGVCNLGDGLELDVDVDTF